MKDITAQLTHKEIVGLLRSLLRSLSKTPENELSLHAKLFARLSEWHAKTLPQKAVKDISRALDSLIGR